MDRSPETRLFRQYWQDGALDLVAGGAVLLIGVGYMFEQMLAEVVVLPLAFAAWFILRRQVVAPRAGYVEFTLRRRERSGLELAGAVAAGVGVLALFVALAIGIRSGPQTPTDMVDAVPALLVALAALASAGLTRSWRFAAYAVLIAAAGAVAVALGTGPGMPLLVGGLAVAGTGAVLLARFVAGSRRFEEGK